MELDLSFMEEALPFLIKAIPVTIFITAATLILSLVPAFLMAEKRVRGGGKGKAEKLIMHYISFIRGTPLVLQVLLVYALMPSILNSIVKALGLPIDVFHDINPLWYAVTVFTINTTALLSEIFRSAMLAVPEGALVLREDQKTVFVVLSDNKVMQRVLKLGDAAGGWVEVKDGVKEGERIVVAGQHKLKDGLSVRLEAAGGQQTK